MTKFTDDRKETFKNFIGNMSYYNAAESPQWGREDEARTKFYNHAREKLFSWLEDGVTVAELKDYMKTVPKLCTFGDFIYDSQLAIRGYTEPWNDELKEKRQAYKERKENVGN